MASEWREATLDQLGRIVTGKTPASNVAGCFGGDIPFVTPTDFDGRRIIESTDRYLTKKGADIVSGSRIPTRAVMVSCIGSDMGKAAVAGRECVTNQQINSIVVESGNDPLFVYYNLSTRKAEIRAIASGSAQPILNKTAFGQLDILLPPLPQQRAVSGFLGTLDDKIELNRRMNETLEAMARALFMSWFVDFDPVRAKAEGRDSGLPEPLVHLFPTRFVESDLGEIPEGWRVTRLDELAEIQGGKQLPTEECESAGSFPVFGANGIMGFTERCTHNGFVIAFGRVGAYCGSVHWTYGGAWINNNASSVVPKEWPEFVLQAMLVFDFEGMRTGSAQPFIPNSSLASVQILRVPDKVMDAFCGEIRSVRIRQHATQVESGSLAALRDTLLPKLMSGELRLKDAEREMEAAL